MKIVRTILCAALVASLAACRAQPPENANGSQDDPGLIARNVEEAMEKGRREMATGNIRIGNEGQGKAEITPQGDLLIEGKPVPVTDAQRALVLAYRAELVGVASAGMDVGVQGARLATRAVGEALRGIFSGNPDEVEKRVEAQAEPIRKAALQLCDRLPALYDAQQKLAAALPAFAPYAKMDPSDIDDCRKDAADGEPPAAPQPPSPPAAPQAPAEGEAQAGATASAVIGKPRMPALPDITG